MNLGVKLDINHDAYKVKAIAGAATWAAGRGSLEMINSKLSD